LKKSKNLSNTKLETPKRRYRKDSVIKIYKSQCRYGNVWCRLVDILSTVLSNPQSYAVMALQFLLGLALGYIAVKALKYILAFIAILALGTFLSVWSLGTSPQDVLKNIGTTVEAIKSLAVALGLMTIGPVAIGFIVGALVALLRK
jgi:glucan phosphoethanolaminetransferase (alkaline phosphatase superfamily)